MIYVVMGVAGSGKTTVGELLAKRMGVPFFDGDDFHPPANVAKMAAGNPLNDDDRAGWLAALKHQIDTHTAGCVVGCSALKQKYRDVLRGSLARDQLQFVHLHGTYAQLLERLHQRKGHFMKPAMLKSQFETLEPPSDALVFEVALAPDEIVARLLAG